MATEPARTTGLMRHFLINAVGDLLEFTWVASFLYGVYCALQAWTNRQPERHRHHSVIPTLEDFTPKGRQYLGRVWRAWAVAIGVLLIATLIF